MQLIEFLGTKIIFILKSKAYKKLAHRVIGMYFWIMKSNHPFGKSPNRSPNFSLAAGLQTTTVQQISAVQRIP